jgi:hypothetical protein
MAEKDDRYVVVGERALLDLVDLARSAATEIRNREIRSTLADALGGSIAEIETQLYASV